MDITGSSNIKAVNYDKETKTMEVSFSNGSRYKYEEVPAEKYEAFIKAESKGKHFATEIRNKFRSTKL